MTGFILSVSCLLAIVNLIQSFYIFSTNKKINIKRAEIIEGINKEFDINEYQKILTKMQFVVMLFMIFYYITAGVIMGFAFIPYFTALLVVLTVNRFVYIKKFLVTEEITKSWPSAILFILTLVFSVLFIVTYFA